MVYFSERLRGEKLIVAKINEHIPRRLHRFKMGKIDKSYVFLDRLMASFYMHGHNKGAKEVPNYL